MSMLYSPAYLNAFKALAQRMHFDRHLAPDVAVAGWQTVIDELKVTTDSHPCELDNDLDVVREPIETFLVADELGLFPEHAYFAQCIRVLDTEFKALTVQQVGRDERTDFRWWEDRVPKYWIDLTGR
jgi:hypothetical protein